MSSPGGQVEAGQQASPGFALLLTLAMAQFVVVLDFTIVNVALPSIQHDLHVATTTLQWLISGYAVAFGGFLLLGGRLADAFGRARLFRIGLVLFVVASMSGGLAVEPGLLIASRVVQGIGAAMLAPAGLSLLVTSWPGEKERSRALGTYGAVASAGFASGAVLGGLLVEATWRLVFFVNVPVGIALLIASRRLLPPDSPGHGRQLDIPGAVTATAGVALLVLAIVRAGDTLRPTWPVLLGAAAIVLLAGFVVRERRAKEPLLNLALLKDRGIAGANLTLIAVGAFSAAQVLLVTLYLQEGRGLNPVLTGLCFIPQAAGAFALSGPAGRVVPALGPRRALAIALSIALLALAGAAVSVLTGSLPGLLVAQFTLGVAARLSQVSSSLAGTHGPVAAQSEGTASALLTATRQCGSALGVAIVSAAMVALHGSYSHRTGVAMLVTTGFALAGLLATLVVPPGPPESGQRRQLFHHHAGGMPLRRTERVAASYQSLRGGDSLSGRLVDAVFTVDEEHGVAVRAGLNRVGQRVGDGGVAIAHLEYDGEQRMHRFPGVPQLRVAAFVQARAEDRVEQGASLRGERYVRPSHGR
ncbi:MAG: MFS transporter [Streptosporangiaceae bacterium]|jgi:EmrB/QacA subfamily drug resistance transporter